jgi:hypothetical protein
MYILVEVYLGISQRGEIIKVHGTHAIAQSKSDKGGASRLSIFDHPHPLF